MTKRKTKEEFINEAEAVHGKGRYGYKESDYVGAHVKVKIECPIHGSYWQAPSDHLSGKGCMKCGKVAAAKNRMRRAKEAFNQKARLVHGDDYDYSNVEYVGAKVKVEINCPHHGGFLQTPNQHLRGSGCPTCGRERFANSFRRSYCSDERPTYLYLVKINPEVVKVGITKDPRSRINSIKRSTGGDCKVLRLIKGNCSRVWEFERALHAALKDERVEIDKFKGSTECYSISKINSILDMIEGGIS